VSDIVIPPALYWASTRFNYIEQAGITEGAYSGVVQTTGYGGDKVGAMIDFTPAGSSSTTDASRLAQLRAFIMQVKKQNRIYLTDNSYTRRGQLAVSELFTNSDFSNSTNGWSITTGAMSVADGVMRVKATAGGVQAQLYQTVSATAYVPYALRSMMRRGSVSAAATLRSQLTISSIAYSLATYSTAGYLVNAAVTAQASNDHYPFFFNDTAGYEKGAYADVSFTSFSRCLLTDSGGNLFGRSKELENTGNWTRANLFAVTANTTAGPDAVVDAEKIVPDSSNSSHYIYQGAVVTAAAQDMMICGYFQRAGHNFVRLQMDDTSTSVYQIFNLQTGAVGATSSVGAGWSNPRAYIADMGGNWYYCALVARKVGASTAATGLLVVQSADSAASFAGNNVDGIYVSNPTFFPSSSPSRPMHNASGVATLAASTQRGGGIYVKGGRAPGESALASAVAAGDWLEIDGQICTAVAPLDLDASGRGYLQVSPAPARELADNTPVILHKPMGRFIFAGDSAGIDLEPGVFGRSSIELKGAPLA
jgi:hypothetical protein